MIEPLYQEAIKELLTGLKLEKGIVITDHYCRDVMQISDRMVVIAGGKSIEVSDNAGLIENGYLRDK